jgi:SAM-dependent methyltransferase
MTGAAPSVRRGASEHRYTDDQFERQLGNEAHAAVIRRRWRIFAAALHQFNGTADPTRRLRLLDAGCGDGINLIGLRLILAELNRPLALVAIDNSPVRVERAKTAERAAGSIALGSVSALPFESSSFDGVLCNHVLEHIPQPEAAALEISRVLRPGGLAIIGVPNEGAALARLRNHVLQRSILKTTDHVNFFTSASLSRLLNGVGLAVEEVRAAGFFVPHVRLFDWAMASAPGRELLDAAGRMLPSQAADLIAVAHRRD